MIEVVIHRYWSDGHSTNGVMFIDDENRFAACWTLEDEHRTSKVYAETRIPAGRYRLRLNKNVAAPGQPETFHQRYLRRFGPGFHRGMIELVDVPDFTGILIHIGNDEDDTAGCILVGEGTERGWVSRSTDAYRRIYPPIALALDRGEVGWIEVMDLDRTRIS